MPRKASTKSSTPRVGTVGKRQKSQKTDALSDIKQAIDSGRYFLILATKDGSRIDTLVAQSDWPIESTPHVIASARKQIESNTQKSLKEIEHASGD